MARTDTLTNYLSDVAEAIKTKKGDDTPILASEFDTEIANLPSGGGGTDWSAIGYSSEPAYIQDAYDYALQIKNNWTSPVNLNSYFKNDCNLVYMPQVPINSSTTYMTSCFAGSYLEVLPLLNTSNVIDMSSAFSETKIKTIPLLNTSNVISMGSTFSGCKALVSIPQLDTSKVTNASSMFSNCKSLTEIPQLDTSNVTNASSMFYGCTNLETIPLLNFGKVTDLNGTFQNLSKLKNLGGFKDLGKAFPTTAAEGSWLYAIDLQNYNDLTHDSLVNVLNNVYDIASLGIATQKIKLGSTNLAKLSAEEIAVATNKGWEVI